MLQYEKVSSENYFSEVSLQKQWTTLRTSTAYAKKFFWISCLSKVKWFWQSLNYNWCKCCTIQVNLHLIWEHVWDARLRKIYLSVRLILFLDPLADLVISLDSKIPSKKKILSGIVYRYTCSNCKVTYYRKSFQQFFY